MGTAALRMLASRLAQQPLSGLAGERWPAPLPKFPGLTFITISLLGSGLISPSRAIHCLGRTARRG